MAWSCLSGRRLLAPAVALMMWLAGTAAGFGVLYRYTLTPGAAGPAPATWQDTAADAPPGLPKLLVFLHPHCPCSRATAGELAELLARCGGRVSADVRFYRPGGAAEGWERTGLWDDVERIPGITVRVDPDGRAAREFGVMTSGNALLYGVDGGLLFSGGLTSARGHAGESAGRRAVADLLEGRRPATTSTPVFGCPLSDDSSDPP